MIVNQMAVAVGKRLANIVEKPEEEEVLAYGAEVVLGSLIKITALILFGTLLGKLAYIFTVALTIGGFRLLSGGVHLSTYYRCLVITLITFIGLGVLAERLALINYNPYLFAGITLLFLVIVILLWVPGSNENRVIESQQRRVKFKLYSIIFIFSVYALMLFLHFYLGRNVALPFIYAMQLGLFWQAFSVTPLGYTLFTGVDQILDKLFVEGGLINAKKDC